MLSGGGLMILVVAGPVSVKCQCTRLRFSGAASLRELANPRGEQGPWRQNIDPNHIGAGCPDRPGRIQPYGPRLRARLRTRLRGCGLEPRAGVDRPAALADLEIEFRAGASAAIPGRGDGVTGRDLLAGGLVETLVVAVETQVSVAVVDDREEPEARQPVGIDHAPLADRFHGRAALRLDQ